MSSNHLLLKLETNKPSKEIQEKALLELRETPENMETGLEVLRKLLEAEKDLCAPLTNDEWLLMFLRTCKFYPESARDLVKRFYGLRRKYYEVTKLLQPMRLKLVFDENLVSILPQRDQHGRRIIVIISGKQWNYNITTQDEILGASLMCLDILQKEPETQINGVVYILDMNHSTFRHMIYFTPYRTKRVLDFVQDHSPIRVKGFHIVNQPRILHPIFAAVRPYFNAKFRDRILLHGNNYKSLHQYISPKCLPKCYGGTLDTPLMYSHDTYKMLADHEQFFKGYTMFD